MSFAKKCWNCGSDRFIETVSRESCPDCGIECNYHGSGANQKYRAASDRKWEREERIREARFREMYEQ